MQILRLCYINAFVVWPPFEAQLIVIHSGRGVRDALPRQMLMPAFALMCLLTVLSRALKIASVKTAEKGHWLGGQFPPRRQAHLARTGKVLDASNEEKRMDLGIDYGRQSVLP